MVGKLVDFRLDTEKKMVERNFYLSSFLYFCACFHVLGFIWIFVFIFHFLVFIWKENLDFLGKNLNTQKIDQNKNPRGVAVCFVFVDLLPWI